MGTLGRICEGAFKEFADYKAEKTVRLDMGSQVKCAECFSNTKHEQISGRKREAMRQSGFTVDLTENLDFYAKQRIKRYKIIDARCYIMVFLTCTGI